MVGVTYIGARSHPCVVWKNQQYLMEHRVYATPRTPDENKDFWIFADKKGPMRIPIDTDLFWLFGFSPMQADCVYAGPSPLPDAFLLKVVPVLREAVRRELETGTDQHVNLSTESDRHV